MKTRIPEVPKKTLTIGLDLGDKSSAYCVLDSEGTVISEQKVRTTPKALSDCFGAMAIGRMALETGTNSPWVSRLLSAMGHEVIVANARHVRLIAQSRQKDDRLDARTYTRPSQRVPMEGWRQRLGVLLHVKEDNSFWQGLLSERHIVFCCWTPLLF